MTSLRNKLNIFEKIASGQHVRVLALGSSNTEHFMVGAHWFDYVSMGFIHTFRQWNDDRSSVDNVALCLNAGTSNNTTAELLARFDRDVTPFKPDLMILTAGINDANPNRHVTKDEFRRNLTELRARVNAWGGDVLFQTYYSCDMERFQKQYPGWAANYAPYTEITREVAGELLNDNFRRWERLRKYDVQAYRLLMRDDLHLNPEGNAVIGLDLLRLLELQIPDENLPWIRGGVFARDCMDLLERMEQNGD
jgi:lysophospholipase L1-like esterase